MCSYPLIFMIRYEFQFDYIKATNKIQILCQQPLHILTSNKHKIYEVLSVFQIKQTLNVVKIYHYYELTSLSITL